MLKTFCPSKKHLSTTHGIGTGQNQIAQLIFGHAGLFFGSLSGNKGGNVGFYTKAGTGGAQAVAQWLFLAILCYSEIFLSVFKAVLGIVS